MAVVSTEHAVRASLGSCSAAAADLLRRPAWSHAARRATSRPGRSCRLQGRARALLFCPPSAEDRQQKTVIAVLLRAAAGCRPTPTSLSQRARHGSHSAAKGGRLRRRPCHNIQLRGLQGPRQFSLQAGPLVGRGAVQMRASCGTRSAQHTSEAARSAGARFAPRLAKPSVVRVQPCMPARWRARAAGHAPRSLSAGALPPFSHVGGAAYAGVEP
jgi:hypothetical protein